MDEKVCWLKIDGEKIPTPSGYTYVEADFDSSDTTRSETGVLNRDRIRAGVLSPKFTWQAITTESLSKILKAVEPEKIVVSIFDPKLRNSDTPFMHTFMGYAQATRETSVIRPCDDPLETWWSLSITFIEY